MLEELSSTWGKLNALIPEKKKARSRLGDSQGEAVVREGVKAIKMYTCKLGVEWQ